MGAPSGLPVLFGAGGGTRPCAHGNPTFRFLCSARRKTLSGDHGNFCGTPFVWSCRMQGWPACNGTGGFCSLPVPFVEYFCSCLI